MLTTITLIILIIGLFVDGYLNLKRDSSIKSLDSRVKQLDEDSNVSDKIHFDAIHNIHQDMEAIRTMLYDLKNDRSQAFNQDFLTRVSNVEKTTNNIISDLDRTIGTIDQVQQRIEEMEVLLRNSINELRK